MPRINQLDKSVVNKIAAGEVIERPANVVKELLENSLDALASRIEIDIAQGGSELIRVVDDGEGIEPDDVLLSVAPHATSKIETADDLFRVQTMGFRGEALASIAEVSRVRIRSRREDAVGGVELEVNCGRIGEPKPCGCPTGTLVEVAQLFANTPVRRKFLKTQSTEFGHISEQFARVALANPRLHMVLKHNNKSVYELPATNQLVERLSLFYGGMLAEKLIWVESEEGDVRMWGYVAHPSESKSTRKNQYIFLNGRWIQDRTLLHALRESYRGLLMVGRQPIAFVFVEMPASEVDVNVHPTKVEVRFQDSQQLYRQMLSMIRTKFLSMDLESELNVRSPSPSTTDATGSPQHRERQVELSSWAASQVSPSAPPPRPFFAPDSNVAASSMDGRPGQAWPSSELDSATATTLPSGLVDGVDAARRDLSETGESPVPSASGEPVADELTAAPQTVPLACEPAPRAMQILDCYLVVDTDEGLAVIDQHALHERVMYEYLRPRVLEGSVESQRMLVPETIEFGPREAALLIENADLLDQLGFGIEAFGTNTVLLNRYPVMLAKADLPQIVRDIAEQLEDPEKKPTRRDILDSLLHMMSCKAAIKAGQRLKPEEIDSLLAQRHLIDDAHHCPHGRPTALVLSQTELDRQFGRLG